MRAPAAKSGTTPGSPRAAIHIGNRGVGIYGNWLYFETPDCNLVSLNLKDGKERWHKPICDLDQMYYGSVAPLVVKNHIITGVSGDDLDIPGYHRIARPGDRRAAVALVRACRDPGEPGAEDLAERRSDGARRRHDLGAEHLRSRAEPALFRHRQSAARDRRARAARATTCSPNRIVALESRIPARWRGISSRRRTTRTIGMPCRRRCCSMARSNGQPRKLLAQASRNGYFFVLDRTTGKNLSTTEFVKTNWAKGVDAKGQPIPDPAKEPQTRWRAGLAESGRRGELAAAQLQSADRACSTSTPRAPSASITSTTTSDKPEGWGGNDRGGWARIHAAGDRLQDRQDQLEPQVGRLRRPRPACLSTAGNLVFAGDPAQQPGRAGCRRPASRCGTPISATP